MVENELQLGEGNKATLVRLEKGETVIAYCLSCRRVLYKGRENFISFRVMESQMRTHYEAYSEPHTIEVVHP